jgi:hypothetical protein
MTKREREQMAIYVADYITEEVIRGNTEIDKWMVLDAIEAYLGGASVSQDTVVDEDEEEFCDEE